MENIDVAKIFEDVADLLDIQGANPFRIRAYRTAARTIGTLGTPVDELVRHDGHRLAELPGIGEDLAGKIVEICRTGRLALETELAKQTPASLVALLRIPGIGPKRAQAIFTTLGVRTLAQLQKAAKAGRLSALPGFGPATERAILQGLEEDTAHRARMPIATAEAYIRPLVAALAAAPGIERIDVAGSFRRRADTVGDVDLLVASAAPAPIARRFLGYRDVRRVLARGDTRCSVVLKNGLQVDLRIVPAASYGAALHYFTGSKAHNIAVRTLGIRKGLKINEYGVFRGDRPIAGREEAEVYAAIGLPWIPPELREMRGELEAARAGRLPALVELDNIRGDLQMHTTATDGRSTLAEMARAAADRGYAYIAITDHTQAVRVAGGLTRAGFRAQFRAIDALQQRLPRLRILKGAEVDILADGTLDLDEATLQDLDVVVAAIHSRFTMPRAAMTKRIVRALRHPRVHILGHPTGRLLGRREPYAIDLPAVVQAAKDHGVMLDINAQPERLDLNGAQAALAREAGVPLVISTDAHAAAELDWMRFGVDQARRAWCEARDIANTLPLSALLKRLS